MQVSDTEVRAIRKMNADGERIADIARALGVSRPTVYAVLSQAATEIAASPV
jgi:DNA invertase Pin-like site-specific DNA recombinase